MDISHYKKHIKHMESNIYKLQKTALSCRYIDEKIYWEKILWAEFYKKCLLEIFIKNMEAANKFLQKSSREEKILTIDELAKYNGKNQMPAYIAVNGIVYDVTFQGAWAGGTHFGLTVGKDLSNEFKSCHNTQSILDKLQKVGTLQK